MIRPFFDTNIILYSVDPRDPRKQGISEALFNCHVANRSAVVSTQVLQEAYHNATRKLGFTYEAALALVWHLSRLEPVGSSGPFVLAAVEVAHTTQISIWDARMVVAARDAGCDVLLTEDLNHGQLIEGVQIVNPFKTEGPTP